MQKELTLTQRIVRIETQQTALTRCMRTLWAWMSRRPVVFSSVPPQSVVRHIVRSYLKSLTGGFCILPDREPNIGLLELLPTGTTTKTLRLHKSKYDYGWAVLRRNKEGKAVKAVWLLKVSPSEARLVLYVSHPRWPQ